MFQLELDSFGESTKWLNWENNDVKIMQKLFVVFT